MFSTITTKTKLLVPMFALTMIMLILGGTTILSSYNKMHSLKKLNQQIIFSSYISNVFHSIQQERGLSCGYVLNTKNEFENELSEQRKKSDKNIIELKKFLITMPSEDFSDLIKKVFLKIDQLEEIRTKIDKCNFSYDKVIKYYSSMNSLLLDIVVSISKHSHIPLITQNIIAYSDFLYFKEYMGIERAEGVAILSQKSLSRINTNRLSNLIALENENKKKFLQYTSENIKNRYNQLIKSDIYIDLQNVRDVMLFKDVDKSNIDSQDWYILMSKNINLLSNISRDIREEISKNIKLELNNVNNIFIFLSGITILSIVVFFMMLVAFFILAKNEQRLRVVMDKYIISSTTDLKGKIIDVSEAFCKISGFSREELIGKNHSIIRHPDMSKEIFRDLWAKITKGKSWRGKVKNMQKNGGFYWVYANIEPLFNTKGVIDSYISIRLDITESEELTKKIQDEESKHRAMQEMMHQQSRLAQMGEMISMIAHQWRQPLSAITAATGSIVLKARRDRLDNNIAIELADKIKGFSQHLSSTIDDFRYFFKSNKSKNKTTFENIINSVSQITKSSLESNNIKFIVDIQTRDILFTYENELKQVLLNLIKNAEDALVDNNIKNPTITVKANKNILTVNDNAGGIPQDIISKIFDPYFSTKTKKDGTGLGLYMSKTIIEEHCSGSLSVKNDRLGAKFKIVLGEHNG